MPVLAICQDSDNAEQLRKTHLIAHRSYLAKIKAMICVAGPTQQLSHSIESHTNDSACLIYDTDDIDIAHKLFKHDPYAIAGVYSHVAFSRFNATVGHWLKVDALNKKSHS